MGDLYELNDAIEKLSQYAGSFVRYVKFRNFIYNNGPTNSGHLDLPFIWSNKSTNSEAIIARLNRAWLIVIC